MPSSSNVMESGIFSNSRDVMGRILVPHSTHSHGLGIPQFTVRFLHPTQIFSGETMAANIEKRGGVPSEGCHPGCVIKCSQIYNDKDNNYLTSGFEYETIWAFGANCQIKDLDDIAMMDRLCDDFGLDTIETGVTIGIAMEGGIIPWGDGKAAIELLKKVGNGDPMGKIIGNGAAFMV